MSEPASRWLIVKQTKATGRMAVKWEETLVARHAHKKEQTLVLELDRGIHPPQIHGLLFSWMGIKASSRVRTEAAI